MPKKTVSVAEVKPKPPAITLTPGELDELDALVLGLKEDIYVTRNLTERIERLEKIILHKKLKARYEKQNK